MKNESTRGFERKSFQMDDTNHLADNISELKKNYPMERPKIQRKKCVDGNKAEWPSGLRSQAQENPQSRILVHECARGFESHYCQKTFWTRWGRAFSWQILSYWNINSRWQCKAKENKKCQRPLWLITEWFKSAQKKKPRRDMWNTNVRMGLNTNLHKWMTQTV